MTVDDFIEAQPQRDLLVALRALVKRIVPDVVEEMKWRVPFYSRNGMLFALETNGRDEVAFCFCHGAELDDPDRILTGQWKRTRVVRIRSMKQTRSRALAAMIARAAERNGAP